MKFPYGRYSIFLVDPETGERFKRFEADNDFMVSWGYAACQLFGYGNPNYRINAVYLEFKNVASPGQLVTVPSFSDTDGLSYYQGLTGGSDYLRVPLQINPQIAVAPGYNNYFEPGQGNQLNIYCQSTGSVGVNGTPFSSSANSTIYGVATVACPVLSDPTQDVLISRGYFPTSPTNQQLLKPTNMQIGVGWEMQFLPNES